MERFIQILAIRLLVMYLLVGAYAYLAAVGVVPAMPWSPIGIANN